MIIVFKPSSPSINMGSDLKVGDIMKTDVITVSEDENILTVSEFMKKYDIGSVVVRKDKKAEGIITERDIVHKVIAGKKDISTTTAGDVMSSPIMVIKPEALLEEAAKAMRMHHIKRLPVISEKNELIGIITEGDIMEIFPAVVDLIEEKAKL